VSRLRSEVTLRVENQLEYYLAAPQVLAEVTVDGFELDQLEVADPAGLTRQFWQLRDLLAPVEASALYVGTEDKEFIGLGFQDNQRWEVGRSGAETGYRFFSYDTDEKGNPTDLVTQGDAYDPTGRPWYQKAKAAGKPTWSDIYVDFKEKRLKITLARPLYDPQGDIKGGVGVDLVLSHVWNLLQQLDISPGAQTYIVDGQGLLVGMSAPDAPFTIQGEDVKRMAALEAPVPLVRETAQALRDRGIQLGRSAADSQGDSQGDSLGESPGTLEAQQLELNLSGEQYFLQIAPFGQEWGLDWNIVVVVPQSDFTGQLAWTAWITFGVCGVAALGALGMGLLTSRWISRPIYQLGEASQKLAAGEWDSQVTVRSPREVAQLAESFNTMAVQLRASFAQLESQNIELQRLDKLKDEFLANTSHELRTPLNGSIGLLESLLEEAYGPVTPRQRRSLEALMHSGCRLSALVDDILDFSAVRRGHFDLQVQPLHLHEVVDEVVEVLQPMARQKGLTIQNRITAELPIPPVMVDVNRLQQILYNLMGNSIKFTAAGHVALDATFAADEQGKGQGEGTDSPQLCLKVSDTGIGIPEEKQSRIFAPFEQADGSVSREYGGAGLGLAIVQQLAQAHGGRVEVESVVGEGTVFSVWLPAGVGESPVPMAEVAGLRVSRPFVGLTAAESADGDRIGEASAAQEGAIAPSEVVRAAEPLPGLPAPDLPAKEERLPVPSPLPSPDKAPVDQGSLQGSTPTDGRSQFQVLVVDDDPLNVQVLTERLKMSNYAIAQASSGQEALEIVQGGFRPDLVLLDVMMPRMSGYEVARRLREQFAANEVPIVMLSAKNQLSDLAMGLESGANDYLTKPVSREELLARLKTHLQLSNLNVAYGR
ncbi:MAG: response regulator, partial [Cyanobacteria bacterium P01_H01_bin.130]